MLAPRTQRIEQLTLLRGAEKTAERLRTRTRPDQDRRDERPAASDEPFIAGLSLSGPRLTQAEPFERAHRPKVHGRGEVDKV